MADPVRLDIFQNIVNVHWKPRPWSRYYVFATVNDEASGFDHYDLDPCTELEFTEQGLNDFFDNFGGIRSASGTIRTGPSGLALTVVSHFSQSFEKWEAYGFGGWYFVQSGPTSVSVSGSGQSFSGEETCCRVDADHHYFVARKEGAVGGVTRRNIDSFDLYSRMPQGLPLKKLYPLQFFGGVEVQLTADFWDAPL